MKKFLCIFLIILCFNPIPSSAASKPIQLVNLPIGKVGIYSYGNELYNMTVAILPGDDFRFSFKGFSTTPYETFIKNFPTALKKEAEYMAFKSNVLSKNSKKAIIEVVTIDDNGLFGNFRDSIPYAQYTITNNGKKGVLISGYLTKYQTKDSWYKEATSNKAPTIYFSRIFKDCRKNFSIPTLTTSIKKRLDSGITLAGLEKKYTYYNLNKTFFSDIPKNNQFTPYIKLTKIKGSEVVELTSESDSLSGTPYLINDYNNFANNHLKKHFKTVTTKNYISYIQTNPYYYELIFVKSKNGKYMYSANITLHNYKKGKYNPYRLSVDSNTIKTYEKDISTLRTELVKLITSLEKNPKLYVK